jgi:hypothetical protein
VNCVHDESGTISSFSSWTGARMTTPKQPQKRRYQQHGLTTLQKALTTVGDMDGWLSELGEAGVALKEMRERLIQDQAGEDFRR